MNVIIELPAIDLKSAESMAESINANTDISIFASVCSYSTHYVVKLQTNK